MKRVNKEHISSIVEEYLTRRNYTVSVVWCVWALKFHVGVGGTCLVVE